MTFDGQKIKQFFETGSRQHEIFGRGDPGAVVFELEDGDIVTVFEESPRYDRAVKLEQKWNKKKGDK